MTHHRRPGTPRTDLLGPWRGGRERTGHGSEATAIAVSFPSGLGKAGIRHAQALVDETRLRNPGKRVSADIKSAGGRTVIEIRVEE